MTQPNPSTQPGDVELLSFRLSDQEYSIDIMAVREIRGWTRATPLPRAAPHMRGVINLRGTVLPVMDLAQRLGIEGQPDSHRSVIVVVQNNAQTVGLLVDAVSDILVLPRTELQPPPKVVSSGHPGFIAALTIVDGRLVRMLDLDAVLPADPAEVA